MLEWHIVMLIKYSAKLSFDQSTAKDHTRASII